MRKSRLVAGLVAVACATALPAVAAAHHVKPAKGHGAAKASHRHPGKGRHPGDGATVRLAPVTGQTAKGVAELKQRTGALSVALVVSHLTPGAFYAAHVHAGTCAVPGAVALTLPDVYADEHGVARLVTTLPTAVTDNYIASGFSVDVHAGSSSSATAAIACGDVTVKATKVHSKAWLKGTTAKGWAEAAQKGTDVTVWIALRGLTPGVHGVHLHAGSCAAPGALAVSLGDITAGADGKAGARLTGTSAAAVVGAGFSLDVQAGATGSPESVVACGDQIQTRKHGR